MKPPNKPPAKCKNQDCEETDPAQFRQRVINNRIYYIKICRKCEIKASKEYYNENKEEKCQYSKDYYHDNKEEIKPKKKEYDKIYYIENRDEKLDYQKDYASNNRPSINQNKKNRRKNDPSYRLRYYISNEINRTLKTAGSSKNNNSILTYTEYSSKELERHIEDLFEPWMNWNNQGVYDPKTWDDNDRSTWCWQLDHIIPQSDLPFSSMDDENFKKCWSLQNLRPLSAKQNHMEGTRRVRHGKR